MRLLVAGSNGQLARALAAAPADPDWRVVTLGRPELDITDRASIAAALAAHRPDVVVNAAAWTAVDRAEAEYAAALAVNRDGAGHLAEAAAGAGVPVIHVSTDYVFSGEGNRPWRESDATAPVNAYGRSKLAGEATVAGANRRHVILRTAWLHSPWGANFVTTMLRLARERDELRVVADQTGTPTYAPDLAAAVLAIAARVVTAGVEAGHWGVVHLTNGGSTSWYGFAEEVFRRAGPVIGRVPRLTAIASADYPSPARRPRFSVLDNERAAKVFGVGLRDWRDGVGDCVTALLRPRGEPGGSR
ncbi:MAG: putative dTDP-4-dehydrorhamnose reductase [Alphaproteobacteria bacterium]|nr:MAG: putative dTDP-4-dehydrorhamnose reductase [Alphaproteobacteria bacterium]